jgi:hypothetical protein
MVVNPAPTKTTGAPIKSSFRLRMLSIICIHLLVPYWLRRASVFSLEPSSEPAIKREREFDL